MQNPLAMPPAEPSESPGFQLNMEAGGDSLRVSGHLGISEAAEAETQLNSLLASREGALRIDLSGVTRIDTVGAWLIHRILRDRPGSELIGPTSQAELLIAEVAAADQPLHAPPRQLPFVIRELERLGLYIINFWQTLIAGLGFVGLTLVSGWNAIRAGRGVRRQAITVQMEQVGVNALGIVGLMSFLIGIVLAQQGAVQLRQFGAEVFVINLVGRATFRELGILLTAIMVAGRSASAFAAQIGSMKLAEEVDAMRTIGLDPVEILVLPRVIALVVMMPLLAFYASILAIVGGGLFAWIDLGIPPATFAQRLREVVPMADFWIGISKAPVFGAIIAIIGCHQGFMVTGNAESVGQRTTLAVVQAIFIVIVLDAVFAVFYSALGFN